MRPGSLRYCEVCGDDELDVAAPQGCHSGAAADAQGCAADGGALTLHLVQHGDDDTQAGAADGVTQSDTGTVQVGLGQVDVPAALFLQLLADAQELSSECLVDLPVIDVVEVDAGALQALGDCSLA